MVTAQQVSRAHSSPAAHASAVQIVLPQVQDRAW